MPARANPEVKAAALADLHAGEQPAVVAERYGLDPAKVRVWKQRYVTATVARPVTPVVTVERPTVRRPAEDARHQTLAELVEANLRAKLIATQRIAEHVTRDEWLATQNATAVAELFEALDRSAIGILDRLAGAHAAQRALPAPGAEDGGGAAE
jgi:hypothetical protein